MKKFLWLFALLTLVACFEDSKPKDSKPKETVQSMCFDIVIVPGNPMLSPILIDKCTGQTWVAQIAPQYKDGKPSGIDSYIWSVMGTFTMPNTFSTMSK